MCIFCALQPTRDQNGAAIAIFTARVHSPLESSHQTTLQVNPCGKFDVGASSIKFMDASFLNPHETTSKKKFCFAGGSLPVRCGIGEH